MTSIPPTANKHNKLATTSSPYGLSTRWRNHNIATTTNNRYTVEAIAYRANQPWPSLAANRSGGRSIPNPQPHKPLPHDLRRLLLKIGHLDEIGQDVISIVSQQGIAVKEHRAYGADKHQVQAQSVKDAGPVHHQKNVATLASIVSTHIPAAPIAIRRHLLLMSHASDTLQ